MNNKVCFVEVKTEKGKLSELQKYRIEELTRKGIEVFVSKGEKILKI